MKFNNLLLLTCFGLFTAQEPIKAAEEKQPEKMEAQSSYVQTTPIHIIQWSGALAAVIICGAAIYYVPSMLKNLHDATDQLNRQTVPALTNIGDQIVKDTGSIVTIVADFSEWLKSFFKDPLTFNLNTKESTLHKLSQIALRELPPHAEF